MLPQSQQDTIHASVTYQMPWIRWIHWISLIFRENFQGQFMDFCDTKLTLILTFLFSNIYPDFCATIRPPQFILSFDCAVLMANKQFALGDLQRPRPHGHNRSHFRAVSENLSKYSIGDPDDWCLLCGNSWILHWAFPSVLWILVN